MITRTRRSTFAGAVALAAVLSATGCIDSDSGAQAGGAGAAAVAADDSDAATTDAVDTSVADSAAAENQVSNIDLDELDIDESDVVKIHLDGSTASSDSADVSIDGSTVTITAAGTYSLTGTLDDGEVIVDAADDDDVVLILDGVDITNTDGSALAVMNADDATVLLADGATNELTDGAAYEFPDAETDEPNATLFSASDLVIAGDGALTVTGAFNDGVASKDSLSIASGTISVVAVDDGVRGKDDVTIDGGSITIDAGGDGIKSDNADDVDRGHVQISGGDVDVTAGDDGIQAATDVIISDGDVTIDAGRSSGTGRALQGDVLVAVSGGTVDAVAVDDAVHSNDTVAIDGGTITLAAGDDGVHGDLAVTIGGGSITITEAFEGIEAEVITIDDGLIDVTSDDDGLNVASSEESATTDPALQAPADAPDGVEPTTGPPARGGVGPGAGPGAEAVGDHYIYINGGTVLITITGELAEQGDGIDANGRVEMTGGLVVVSGPTDTRNSAVDYSGGTFVMTGGTFIGTNVDGRNSEGIGTGSTQPSLYVTTGSTVVAGTLVHITDSDGEALVTFEPHNDFSVIVFSSPDLVEGESYDVYLGGSVDGDSDTDLHDASTYVAGELAGTITATVSA